MVYSSYAGYRGRCIGRVLHFLHNYVPNLADHCQIGANHVEYSDKKIATFVWARDVPIFTFIVDMPNNPYLEKALKYAQEAQNVKLDEIIEEGDKYQPENIELTQDQCRDIAHLLMDYSLMLEIGNTKRKDIDKRVSKCRELSKVCSAMRLNHPFQRS